MLEGVGGVSHDDDVVSYQYSSGYTDVISEGEYWDCFPLSFLLDSQKHVP